MSLILTSFVMMAGQDWSGTYGKNVWVEARETSYVTPSKSVLLSLVSVLIIEEQKGRAEMCSMQLFIRLSSCYLTPFGPKPGKQHWSPLFLPASNSVPSEPPIWVKSPSPGPCAETAGIWAPDLDLRVSLCIYLTPPFFTVFYAGHIFFYFRKPIRINQSVIALMAEKLIKVGPYRYMNFITLTYKERLYPWEFTDIIWPPDGFHISSLLQYKHKKYGGKTLYKRCKFQAEFPSLQHGSHPRGF